MPPAEDGLLRCLWRKCRDAGPFISDKELYEHLEEVHTVYKQSVEFKCRWDGCGRRYRRALSRGERARHLITHTDYRPYVCTRRSCGASFYRKDHLKKHRDAHAKEEEEVDASDGGDSQVAHAPSEIACKLSDQSFSSAPARRAHMSSVHAGRPASPVGAFNATINNTGVVSCLDVEDWSDEESPLQTLRRMTIDPWRAALTDGLGESAKRLLAAEKRIRELEALLRARK